MPSATRPYIAPTSAPVSASSPRSPMSTSGHLADRERAADGAGLAALVGDAGILDHGCGTGIEGRNQRLIALLDHVAAELAGASDFAVVRIEILVQIDEAAEPQRRRQALVDVRQNGRNELCDFRLLRQIGIRCERDTALFRPVPGGFEIDADNGSELVTAGAEDRDVAHIRTEFDPVLDVIGNETLASARAHY